MIKTISAVTREIDDPQAAAAEIVAAISPDRNLMKNSLGIISCFSEFEDTGALKAVCDALPFECVGATTCMSASVGEIDQVILAVTVLTSDDCEFKTAELAIAEDYAAVIGEGIAALMGGGEKKPAAFMSYFPMLNIISGDMVLEEIDRASGGIPLFGMVCTDHSVDYSGSRTIHNGKALSRSVVMAAIFGAPQITYSVASADKSRIRSQKAVITASSGNILQAVNGKTVLDYLSEIGLGKDELSAGVGAVPFFIYHRSGTEPVARVVYSLTPEGYAICGGAMPENAVLGIGHIDMNDVLTTTRQTLGETPAEGGCVLCYSCIGRYMVLGANNTAEAERYVGAVGNAPGIFAYSSSEICPLPDSNGRLRNFFHNYTAVVCRIK
ncbi:MAG: FIST C-terminal domain-containing protein [Oscillospiraceae bacterium]|jgi:hypothetical protein|nr:FIST C-terminal domain-containing protein [Oscillospiraceae bacterium]